MLKIQYHHYLLIYCFFASPFYPIKSLPKSCYNCNDSFYKSCCTILIEIFLSYYSSSNSANNL